MRRSQVNREKRMNNEIFANDDLEQIRAHGLTLEEVEVQLNHFRQGMKNVRLRRPCRVGDGIIRVGEGELTELIVLHDQAAVAGRFLKFVPASGAASRMFENWHRLLAARGFSNPVAAAEFRGQLEKYAFYDDVQRLACREGIASLDGDGELLRIVELILSDEALGYQRLPKAMIKFHNYPFGSRTALEEQVLEGLGYLSDGNGLSRFHFTLGEDDCAEIEKFVGCLKKKIESELPVRLSIGFSCQSRATDTIAVDPSYRPFRDSRGRLVFRPGGHGSLLENLQAAGGDIVFIKNIDNVAREELLPLVTLYKKVLSGTFIRHQRIIFGLLAMLEEGDGNSGLAAAKNYLADALNIGLPSDFESLVPAQQRQIVNAQLDRPLRVCGVVPNAGEPGGGPFFVVDETGRESLQIVESFQVDRNDPGQVACWSAATHFNPVDLVCGMRDRRGIPYQLSDFIDERYYCISKKSKDGKDLLALERPGLWNGSMGRWNSIFVEVPLATFNPVKSVEDLLRPQHQGS